MDNKNKLDGMIFTVEKSITDLGDKLSVEDKAQLEETVKHAKDELASDDDDRIKAATEKLTQESQQIFAKVYQQAQASGDAGASGGPNGDEEFHQK